MANLLFFHTPDSRCHIIILEAADKHWRHHLVDFRHRRIPPLRGCAHRYVAVGEDAEGLLALADQHASKEILRVAREEKVDLIVMGTHGGAGLRHLLLGSVAEAVAHYAHARYSRFESE